MVRKSPMVGRQKELQHLQSVIKADIVSNLRGFAKHRVIGIKGEAGMGKSRLCHEFLNDVDAKILKGSTLPYAQPPYWLWITLLRHHFAIAEGDPNGKTKLDKGLETLVDQLSSVDETENLRSNLIKNKPFLGRLLDIEYDDDRLKKLDDKAKNLETWLSLRYFIQATAYQRQTIVQFEDFHLEDTSSSDALKFIIENTDTKLPVLFICPYRPEGDLPEVHDNYSIKEVIEITSVTDEDCRELLRYMLDGVDLPQTAQQFILERAGGNPFFLEEVLLSLVQKGIIQRKDNQWDLAFPLTEAEIPRTINAVILSRIDDLDPILKEVLKRASVIGLEFLLRVLSQMNQKLADIEGTEAHIEFLARFELILESHLPPQNILSH